MLSDLNKFFPRKKKIGRKSSRSSTARGAELQSPAGARLEPDSIMSDCFRTPTIVFFGRQPGSMRDIFIKGITFDSSIKPTIDNVKIFRAYREEEGSIRCEESNIKARLLTPECILHICDVFLTESFGLRLDLEGGDFLVDSEATAPIVLQDFFGRSVRAEVREAN